MLKTTLSQNFFKRTPAFLLIVFTISFYQKPLCADKDFELAMSTQNSLWIHYYGD